MADQPGAQSGANKSALAGQLPDPPAYFWKDFTSENVARINKLRAAVREASPTNDSPCLRIPDLPEELRNLQPPEVPADGKWRVFGDQYMLDDKLPTLEEQGIQRLVSEPAQETVGNRLDRAFELKRLVKSLLLNFLELVGILANDPIQAATKVDDLRTLLINFHHILNEYRPHQAREQAIQMMQTYLDRTRAETAAIRAQVDKAKRVLEGLASIEVPQVPPPFSDMLAEGTLSAERITEAARIREKEVWCLADDMLA